MNDLEKGWVAGLLEGEGYFPTTDKYKIECEMTDQDVIEKLKLLVGGKVFERDSRKKNWKPTYFWVIRGQNAIDLMEEIQPLMGKRRYAAIETILKRWYDKKEQDESRKLAYEKAVEEYRKGNISLRQTAIKYGVDRNRLSKLA